RRDGLHGELPGLQRVHADSNPDTGVSNFLSAPPRLFGKHAFLKAGNREYAESDQKSTISKIEDGSAMIDEW
ncbi:hypothetical protein, partial [Adlercreutzia sp. CNCM I-6207]